LRLLYGDGASDTVLSKPGQALVIEVRGENGSPVQGTVVRFEALPIDSANPYSPGVYVAPLTSQNFLPFAADSAEGHRPVHGPPRQRGACGGPAQGHRAVHGEDIPSAG